MHVKIITNVVIFFFKSENLEVQEMDVAENDGAPVENINSDQPAESRFQFVLVLL